MDAITMLAPAKLNLALDVVGLLPNGYHALDMVMQAVSIYERITLQKGEGVSLRLPGSDLPADERNLAVRAARAFFAYTNLPGGVCLTVEKRTPVQAGMGGGSADAAGVLAGLCALYAPELGAARPSPGELCALGAQLGADVPFALTGGTCRVQGVGDFLCPLPPLPACGFVILMPAAGVSTPAAFRAFDAVPAPFHPDVAALDAAVRRGDLPGVCAAAGNALEAVSGAETPRLRRALRAAGARAALMTGSGAAVYGIWDTPEAAQAAAKTLAGQFGQVYAAAPVRGGPRPE